jgi:uncharacterized protein
MKPLSLLFLLLLSFQTQAQNWKKVRALVYTKNGKGYVHDNIPEAVKCIRQLGQEHGFAVEVTDQPGTFTEENLRKYTLLIFTSTNNDVFDTDEQRLALRRYIEAGGGFVGIHSVVGTERNWLWFKQLVGGTFLWHPKFQPYRLRVLDPTHSTMQGLPTTWVRSDECYFMKELSPGPTATLAHDLTSLDTTERAKITASASPYNRLYPAAWYHHYDGGITWCTALGHSKETYTDPMFVRHLFQGIQYVAAQVRPLDYRRAYATQRDMELP